MVLGGVIIPEPNIKNVHATLRKYRDEENMHAELKWTKVTNQKVAKYVRFVDYFFALNNKDQLHFHSLILDSHQFDHRKFNQGDKELGYYKFLYQLLLHCFGRAYHKNKKGDYCLFIVHPDQRTSSYSLEALRNILNWGMAKKFDAQGEIFKSIEPQDSKQADIAQLNDIIIGAIGFQKNGGDLIAGTRKAKINLAEYIAKQAGLKSLKNNTAYGRNRFKIWNFRLQK